MKSKLLQIFSMVLVALAFSACAGFPKFPKQVDAVYELSKDGSVCGQYVIVDRDRLLFKHAKDYPASTCYGMFGFHRAHIAPVLDWGRDVIDYGKDKCK